MTAWPGSICRRIRYGGPRVRDGGLLCSGGQHHIGRLQGKEGARTVCILRTEPVGDESERLRWVGRGSCSCVGVF